MESKFKEQLDKQRSRKRKQDRLHEALSCFSDFDLNEVCNIQAERLVDVVLRCKIEPDDLLAISYLVTHFPATLPLSTREKVLSDVVTNAPLLLSISEANTLFDIFLKFPRLLIGREQATAPDSLINCKLPLFRVLAPPCSQCLNCGGLLSLCDSPTTVTIFTLEDIVPALKIILKCQRCDIRYGYAFYGNITSGYRLYDSPRDYVEASTSTYFHRKLCLSQIFEYCCAREIG